ncbi:hypothetical protein K457DRAFT_29837 [Linnemannia elongata AG-77]|uniref:Uncharacterized protein n=1 Tax=Linnemannia elongata AG-77 TaxID=1314771 RepID=A0A197K758_9FUNG|nr:hypothetical protein K457DRAFT_29837 [Linnemannia elongata AG-77]
MTLPTECFQLIFEILATEQDTKTLSTLLRVSKPIQVMALPYLYQEPFWVFRREQALEHAHHDIVQRLQDYPRLLEKRLEHRPPRRQRRFAKWDSFSLTRMLLGCVRDKSVVTDFLRIAYKLDHNNNPRDPQAISATGPISAPVSATATETEAIPPAATKAKAAARRLARTMLSGPPSIDCLAFLRRLRVNYYTQGNDEFQPSLRRYCLDLDPEQRANSRHAALFEEMASRGSSRIRVVRRTNDILSMDLTWALCNERLEQLQSLTIYLEEMERYLAVVDRLPQLNRVCFEQGTEEHFTARSDEEKQRMWQRMVLFVERHTELFGTLREIDYPACPQSMRWSLWRALPVVLDPREIDATNWLRFHAQTDRTRLDHVTSILIPAGCFSFLQGYLKTMEQSEPYLQRCRALQAYEMPFLGAGVDSFEWAVKEKLEAGYTRQGPNTSTLLLPSIYSLSLSDWNRPSHHSRVMVKHIKVQANVGVLDEWLEDVVFAFSESLETLSARDDVSNPQLCSTLVTRWNLPRLRQLEMQRRRRSLRFDTGMLVHCPLLEELVLRDHMMYLNDFVWDAVVLQEPLRLPKLRILRLKGIPAITFHPHSFLTNCSAEGQDNKGEDDEDFSGMPNLHTLSLNVNGSMDYLPTHALSQSAFPAPSWMTVPTVWSLLRDRSFWNWTWNLPLLTVLELRGEFGLYFDLTMLKRTPALEVLCLDIWSRFLPLSAQTRTLDLSELAVTQEQGSEAVAEHDKQQDLLLLPRLTHLHLQGPWVINGPTLKTLFTRVMPNLICISECGCQGFYLREWMEATVELEHLLSSSMVTMTSQDVPLQVIKDYELKAAERSTMETLMNVFLESNESMELSILANWWPGTRRQRELKEGRIVEYVFAGSVHTRPRRALKRSSASMVG